MNQGRGHRPLFNDETIMATLHQVQVSVMQDDQTKRRFLVPSAITPAMKTLYRQVGLSLQDQTKLMGKHQAKKKPKTNLKGSLQSKKSRSV
ncbi:MAG: hypothetical protein OXC92_02650 [Flavobacteriaceae bacterium]|nr:hypothetical protein [Flavobacteriaceae bacterium]MCY4215868.1 hypothetical protein [Flavobacteriaceae bacterium]MCY4254036.1 hypothetical protein [Flavobacteriaceae bacterium]